MGEMLGIPGNGTGITFRLAHVWEYRDGLVSRENVWLDSAAAVAPPTREPHATRNPTCDQRTSLIGWPTRWTAIGGAFAMVVGNPGTGRSQTRGGGSRVPSGRARALPRARGSVLPASSTARRRRWPVRFQ